MTLSRLASHRQMKLPPACSSHYLTHAPGCTPRAATAAAPTLHNGPIHQTREWVQWTHPLVSGMGVQWQACLAPASNRELWHSVPVLQLNVVLYTSCCQQARNWGQFKTTAHHSPSQRTARLTGLIILTIAAHTLQQEERVKHSENILYWNTFVHS